MAPESRQRCPLLLHVGFVKCASSWLQQRVFLPDLGFAVPWKSMDNTVITKIVTPHPRRFRPNQVGEEFQEALQSTCPTDGVPVISCETLVGNPILGQFHGHEVAERLHAVFPKARVLICIREQVSMLFAIWAEYIRRGGVWGIDRFVGLARPRQGYGPICRLDHLEYDLILAEYRRLYGAGSVLCLPVEMLRSDAGPFLSRLADFAGVGSLSNVDSRPVYKGLGAGTLKVLRILNHAAPYDPLGWQNGRLRRVAIGVRRQLERRMPYEWQERCRRTQVTRIGEHVKDYYAHSNERLQVMIDLKLSSYGYRCAGREAASLAMTRPGSR